MRKYLLAIVGLVLLCLLAALGTASGAPSTFTVNTTDDTDDSTCDASHCSLREAISAANSDPGSTIEFSIPATDTGHEVSGITGTWTISLASLLPTLTGGGTIISGTSQGNLNPDRPEIEISGASMGYVSCLVIQSADNVIHGLVINRCPLHGVAIFLTSATTNTVSGNYIGTDASGSTDLGNGVVGVWISDGAQGNLVGGDIPEERNVISGNDEYGVHITNDADWNTVSGNYIGTDVTGATKLGNADTGIAISSGSQNNTVGGDTEEERNIISGNDSDGVSIYGSGTTSNTISGNYIGTDATGAQGLGNGAHGVAIYGGAQNNTVGGDTEGERNIISDNGMDGVNIQGGTGNNTISGNFIGTVVSGTQALGNGNRGVRIVLSPNNTIGGDTAAERNVISGNDVGVSIVGSAAMSNTVSGNYIGTDASGSSDRGNAFHGVQISSGAQNNTIGGQTAGERNVISGNNFYGVLISLDGTDGNTVSGNNIGTDATGTQKLGNTYDGVMIDDGPQNNTVGGQTAGERNVISGNNWSGVHIKGDGTDWNTVSANYIGTDVTGTQDKGNGYDGVRIEAAAKNNTIGPDNLIALNSSDGVEVSGTNTLTNTITRNSIHSNGLLGIDNIDGGNDEDELPPLAISGASCTAITGTAPPSATVELFTSPDDEGKTYLTTVSADGSGNWSASGFLADDAYLTATATDAAGNTSEFSAVAGCGSHTYVPLVLKGY